MYPTASHTLHTTIPQGHRLASGSAPHGHSRSSLRIFRPPSETGRLALQYFVLIESLR